MFTFMLKCVVNQSNQSRIEGESNSIETDFENGCKDARMLDIVVETKSNLIRNSIILKSSFIEVEIPQIVAKHSNQASRSNRAT